MLDLDVYLLAWEFYTLEAISVMLGRSEYGDFQPMRHSHSRWYQDFQEFRNRYVSQFAFWEMIRTYLEEQGLPHQEMDTRERVKK